MNKEESEDQLPVIWTGPEKSSVIVVLAHGAGAAMDSPFMDYFAEGIAKGGVRVLRFEFPYMAERRKTGKKRPPDSAPKLLTSWRQVVSSLPEKATIYIGGKSMGGRMASLIADALFDAGKIAGLICLGYPFHAPGKQDKPRTDHLKGLKTPALILQGERDAMGNRETVMAYDLSDQITFHWANDGNHDLSPRKRSGFSQEENWAHALEKITDFIGSPSQG